jgi:hypothetical protein
MEVRRVSEEIEPPAYASGYQMAQGTRMAEAVYHGEFRLATQS